MTFEVKKRRKMLTPKWLTIARNEYRIRTSSIRRIRSYFLYLVIIFLAIYAAYITPAIAKELIDRFAAIILSQAAIFVTEIMLFLMFCYLMIIPISSILREEQTGQLHIFLKAPIKSSDVLLGTYLGAVPFYAIFITIITGLFTALLNPMGLNLIQITITIIIFIVISLSAFWIGTVIAALLRTKLEKTARGKDIGRALALILALPLLALYFAFVYGGLLEKLADPSASGIVKTFLSWLPSSWGAEVIVNFASNPGNTTAVWNDTVIRFGSLLAFFALVLWLGTKAADRAYSLEAPTFIGLKAKPDGVFYKTVKSLGGGGSFGTVLVSVYKDFSRNLENLLFATYILGALFLMSIFLGTTTSPGPDNPPVALIMIMVMFPFIVVMFTGDVTVKGKEALYMCRKAPFGEGRLVNAMLVKSWMMAVPLAGVVTAVMAWFTLKTTLIALLVTTGLTMVFIAAFATFVLGLFLLNPAYSEKSIKLWINIIIAVFVSVGLLLVSTFCMSAFSGWMSERFFSFLHIQLIQTALTWLLGSVVLFFGKRKLRRIE